MAAVWSRASRSGLVELLLQDHWVRVQADLSGESLRLTSEEEPAANGLSNDSESGLDSPGPRLPPDSSPEPVRRVRVVKESGGFGDQYKGRTGEQNAGPHL